MKTPGKRLFIHKYAATHLILLAAAVLLVFHPTPSSAEMNVMTDAELATVTGHGFSHFYLNPGDNNMTTAIMDFTGVRAWTYTEIDSFKMGYYNDGTSLGWDQDWTNASIGSDAEDMALQGFFIQAEFENIGDSATRQLKGVRLGFRNATGVVNADTFASFSGDIGADIDQHRVNLTGKQIVCNGGEFSLSIDLSDQASTSGIRVHFGAGATIQDAPVTSP